MIGGTYRINRLQRNSVSTSAAHLCNLCIHATAQSYLKLVKKLYRGVKHFIHNLNLPLSNQYYSVLNSCLKVKVQSHAEEVHYINTISSYRNQSATVYCKIRQKLNIKSYFPVLRSAI